MLIIGRYEIIESRLLDGYVDNVVDVLICVSNDLVVKRGDI